MEMRRNEKNEANELSMKLTVQILLLMFGYLGVIVIGKKMLGSEFIYAMRWWLTLLVLGVSCLPLTNLLFSGYHDGGFLFSKAIGLAVNGWLLWLGSSLHILKFTRSNCLIVVGIVSLINIAGYVIVHEVRAANDWHSRIRIKSPTGSSEKIVLALTLELVFLFLFLAACYVKCYKPEAYGTEKFMDYGFMTTLMRTEYMPPEDLWFSGTNLNYYYLGQYLATFLTKLSGVTVNVGYNLDLAMLLAFCFTLTYSIAYEVMRMTIKLRNEKKKQSKKKNDDVWKIEGISATLISHTAGLLAGTAVTFAGNMHYIIFAKIIPIIQNMLGMQTKSYWFPDATRYIGYNPETSDKTIHEFPSYSFVLGDLHAHVTNIMFVLTVLGILYGWLLYRKERMDAVQTGKTIAEPYSLWLEVFHPSILVIGFFIGIFQMTNYWDFPIYYVVSGAIILFSNAVIHEFKKETVLLTALQGILILAISFVVSLMFTLRFDSMTGGIAVCTDHTPLYQLAVLWGLPFTVLIAYLVSLVCEKKQDAYKRKKESMPLLFQFIGRLNLPELFILTIGLCAAGLILIPEVVYVVDIYSSGYKRSNTMFKLTYQAFIMFGLMMGYVITKFVLLAKNGKQLVCGILTGVLLIATVGYFDLSVESWFGDVKDKSRFQGLDAAAFVDNESVYDAAAVDWINENIKGTPVMLEAHGTSYTYDNRVSVLTGLPTVIGWHTHEWLWKNDVDLVNERVEIVKQMYTSTDMDTVESLLRQYEVSYIYIGEVERTKFADTGINEEGLQSLGTIVYENDGAYIIKLRLN